MTAYLDTVTDEYGRPVEGASVYVFDKAGAALVDLTDGVSPIANPIVTDETGLISFDVPYGAYLMDVHFGGRTQYKGKIFVGGSDTEADFLLRDDLIAPTGGALIAYTPPSTGTASTVKAFLDNLWSAGADLIRGGTLKASKFYNDDSGNYIERNARVTIQRTTVDPVGIVPSYWSLHEGNGDNASFRGVSGGYLKSKDRSGITASQRGVLYGLQLSVEPSFTRNNYPNDDAVCLVVQNEGVGKGTEAIYVGETPRALQFTGSISGGVLTVTAVDYGTLAVGALIFGTGIPDGVTIAAYGTGTGGTGTYTLSSSFSAASGVITGFVRDFDAALGIDANTTVAIYAAGDYEYFLDTMWGGFRSTFRQAMFRVPDNTNLIYGRNTADTLDLPILSWVGDKVVLAGKTIEAWQGWTPTFSADSGSFTTVTIASARWCKINGTVHFELSFQITNKGTAAGSIKFTPPVVAANSPVCVGRDASNGAALTGSVSSGVFRLSRYDSADPIVDTHYYSISGSYEAA